MTGGRAGLSARHESGEDRGAMICARPMNTLCTGTLAAFALVGAIVGASTSARAGDEACTSQRFELPAVKTACEAGGRAAAKKLMNDAMKKAKAAGEQVTCKSCHTDVKASFALTPNAVDELRKWL